MQSRELLAVRPFQTLFDGLLTPLDAFDHCQCLESAQISSLVDWKVVESSNALKFARFPCSIELHASVAAFLRLVKGSELFVKCQKAVQMHL